MNILHLLKILNTDEYWPIWIAFITFTIQTFLRNFLNIGPEDFKVWNNKKEFYIIITDIKVIVTIIILSFFTIICVTVYHTVSNKNANLNTPQQVPQEISLQQVPQEISLQQVPQEISSQQVPQEISSQQVSDSTPNYIDYVLMMLLAILSKCIGTYYYFKVYGFGTAFWCILSGFIFKTFFKYTNKISLEIFIKIGIVLFANDLNNILQLGGRAIVVAWVETCILLIFTLAIGNYILKLHVVDNLLVSSGLCICGSSAVICVADILNNDEILTKSVTKSIMILSLFSIPFIITLPILCKSFGVSDVVCGAWIGGSIDSTGSVLASASLVNLNVLNVSIVMKMLQNLLIGPIVLVISVFIQGTFNFKVLFKTFPKFILGFIIVCIVTTLLNDKKLINDCIILSEWFSNLSFVIIGMEIDILVFKEFDIYKSVLLYCIGQTVDTFTTFGVSNLMFS